MVNTWISGTGRMIPVLWMSKHANKVLSGLIPWILSEKTPLKQWGNSTSHQSVDGSPYKIRRTVLQIVCAPLIFKRAINVGTHAQLSIHGLIRYFDFSFKESRCLRMWRLSVLSLELITDTSAVWWTTWVTDTELPLWEMPTNSCLYFTLFYF